MIGGAKTFPALWPFAEGLFVFIKYSPEKRIFKYIYRNNKLLKV
jgi:hypothetical protein